jgi:hypothetical protein
MLGVFTHHWIGCRAAYLTPFAVAWSGCLVYLVYMPCLLSDTGNQEELLLRGEHLCPLDYLV